MVVVVANSKPSSHKHCWIILLWAKTLLFYFFYFFFFCFVSFSFCIIFRVHNIENVNWNHEMMSERNNESLVNQCAYTKTVDQIKFDANAFAFKIGRSSLDEDFLKKRKPTKTIHSESWWNIFHARIFLEWMFQVLLHSVCKPYLTKTNKTKRR